MNKRGGRGQNTDKAAEDLSGNTSKDIFKGLLKDTSKSTSDGIGGGAARTLVVLPAYNAARTLEDTLEALPVPFREHVLVVDDGSSDDTVGLARSLGLPVIVHPHNRGYGANQKTCYQEALRRDFEVVVMLHPDGQYDALAVPRLVAPIVAGQADVVLGSRLLERDPRADGMPFWRYGGNRLLTTCQNRVLNLELTDYHTGLRAFSTAMLRRVRYLENSDDFVFDQQILAQAVAGGFRILEVPARCRYFAEASSISFPRSVRYGLETLLVLARYRRHVTRPGTASFLAPAGDGADASGRLETPGRPGTLAGREAGRPTPNAAGMTRSTADHKED